MEDNFDKDFDRVFARDLNAAGKKERPEPGEWSALSTRLDATTPRWNGRAWLPWLLLALLLVSNGWMAVQWQNLRREVSMVRQKTEGAATAPAASPTPVTTLLYDTIYRTVVITRQIHSPVDAPPMDRPQRPGEANRPVGDVGIVPTQADKGKTQDLVDRGERGSVPMQADNGVAPKNGLPIPEKNIKNIGNQVIITDLIQSNTAKADPLARHANTEAPALATPSAAQDSTRLGDKSLANPRFPKQDSTARQTQPDTAFESLLAPSRTLSPPIKKYRAPLHLRMGASVGLTALLADDDIRLSAPLAAQLQVEIGFGRHWAIVPGCLYQTYGYQTEHRFDPRLGIEPPPALGQEYKLRHIEGGAQDFVPSLSVQYRFRPDKKLSGYLGAGYALRLTQHHKTEFEFVHTVTGVGYQQENPAQPFYGNSNASLQGGLEYAIRPRLTLWGGLNGLFDLGASQRVFPVVAGLVGVKYSVK